MVPEGPFGNPARGVTTWDLKAPRGWQQPEVRGRLREVASQSLVLGVVLLRQQAHVVAPASARTNTAPARSSSPCWASACTSQKVQTRNVPSAPSRPSVDITSGAIPQDQAVFCQRLCDGIHRGDHPMVVGRQEAD